MKLGGLDLAAAAAAQPCEGGSRGLVAPAQEEPARRLEQGRAEEEYLQCGGREDGEENQPPPARTRGREGRAGKRGRRRKRAGRRSRGGEEGRALARGACLTK